MRKPWVEVMVVIAIIITLIALILPAIQKVRASADMVSCANKIRNVGIALHLYHTEFGRYPPGCSDARFHETPSLPFASWTARLLPYLEEGSRWQTLLQNYQIDKNFLTRAHTVARYEQVGLFCCPSDDLRRDLGDPPGLTSYLGVSGLDLEQWNGVMYLNSRTRFSDITDGTSNTVVVGERPPSAEGDLGWWYAGWGQSKDGSADSVLGVRELNRYGPFDTGRMGPFHFVPGKITEQTDAYHFWSLHPNGAFFLFGDGSVRFLAYSADSVIPSLATRAGGEPPFVLE